MAWIKRAHRWWLESLPARALQRVRIALRPVRSPEVPLHHNEHGYSLLSLAVPGYPICCKGCWQ